MKALTSLTCAEFPRMIGERCTFRNWLYLAVNWDLDKTRLLFAPIPEARGTAKAAPFVVLSVSLAKVGWSVNSVEYFDSLPKALAALQGGAQ